MLPVHITNTDSLLYVNSKNVTDIHITCTWSYISLAIVWYRKTVLFRRTVILHKRPKLKLMRYFVWVWLWENTYRRKTLHWNEIFSLNNCEFWFYLNTNFYCFSSFCITSRFPFEWNLKPRLVQCAIGSLKQVTLYVNEILNLQELLHFKAE